jgi:hypothetical protein
MVSAAIVAVAAWAVRMHRLSRDYRLRSEDHAVAGYEAASEAPPRTNRSGHHWLLHEKYKRAADRPWLPVDPDPPEPD